ncbi:MAG: pyruvate water dikinase, partial [Halothiobacillaceae bacterium]
MRYIRHFKELGINDIPLVGGKNASLGEMYRELSQAGIKVPNGFATTAEAYRYYLEHNHLKEKITQALAALDVSDVDALNRTGAQIRQWLNHGEIPADLAAEICAAYAAMAEEY